MKVRLTLIYETEFKEDELPYLLRAVENEDDQYINESFGVLWEIAEEKRIELISKKSDSVYFNEEA